MSHMTKAEYTLAEKALIEGIDKIGNHLPGNVDNIASRQKAMEIFARQGLPSRKIEAWHYTDLRTLLRNIPAVETKTKVKSEKTLLPNFIALPLLNGKTAISGNDLPAQSIADKLSNGSFLLPQDLAQDDIIGQINTAYVSDGWHINLDKNKDDIDYIEIQNCVSAGQSHTTTPVHIAKGKKAVIIERQLGTEEQSFSSAVNKLVLEDEAEVLWVIIRQPGQQTIEFNQFNAILHQNAKLKLYIINAGTQLLRQEIKIDLYGEKSDFQLRGVNLLSGTSHSDITMTIRHLVENTTSTEILRNVVMDKARGVFQGMIRVAREAQKTDARMACNSLILSDEAEFDAKPELEIFADDVACGHGATVTEINHDHLFYLMARGIPKAIARGLLVKAFVQELIEELEDKALEEAFEALIEQWLVKHL